MLVAVAVSILGWSRRVRFFCGDETRLGLKPSEEFYSEMIWVKAASVDREATTDTNNCQLDACRNLIKGNYSDTHHF
jgi:hypothetical protein